MWTPTGDRVATLRGHIDVVKSVHFSPDGKQVVTSSFDGTARVWDAGTGKNVSTLRGHRDRVITAAFSPDGNQVVTASEDKTARVWDAKSGKLLGEMRGHTSRLNSANFSPDGGAIITASGDGTPNGDTTARAWTLADMIGFRVDELSLRADPAEYAGPCPAIVRFLGKISVLGGSGTAKYRFVSDDGVVTEPRTLNFDSPGSKDVSTSQKIGGSRHPTLTGSFFLQVLEPRPGKASEIAKFNVRCTQCALSAPQSVTPPNGTTFNSNQREQLLKWSDVRDASGYKVEVQSYDDQTHTWISMEGVGTTSTASLKVSFRDASRFQWRVTPVNRRGQECEASPWAEVRFAQ